MTGNTVWLASYSKSGSTWIRAVYTAWVTGGAPDLNDLLGGPIAAGRAVFLDAMGIPSSDLRDEEIEALRPCVDEVLDDEHDAPFLRKVHDAWFPAASGEPVMSLAATRAALYLIRDPRDVAVSLVHHGRFDPATAVAHMCDHDRVLGVGVRGLPTQLRQRVGSWSDHVRSWIDDSPLPVHVLRYEDVHAEPFEALRAAFAFGGFDVTDTPRLENAIDAASFVRLRDQESTEGFRERLNIDAPFFRRGEVGTWKEELAPDLARRLEEAHTAVMQRFGYLE